MTDRTVKVSLLLEATGYMQGFDAAQKKTRETGTELEKLAQKQQAFSQLGGAALAMGAAFGVGTGLAVSKFAEFDQQMSYVQARTHETAGNMDLLRDAALEAGASTVYSATEAAAAVEELAAAGVSTADILAGGLTSALDLAAAGGLAVADAAQITATTLNQFKLRGEDATKVADLLAAGAGEAVGEVSDMAAALNQSGLVAEQFGLSVEETTGTLAAFASNSLLGSDAGTSFRTMLLRLANPTKEVQGLMKDIGLEAYDAQGNFIGLSALAGELETSFAGMTEQQKQTNLAMIFGQDAIRASTILLDEGAAGIAEWTAKVDQQGYAAETAATRLDNLRGDWEALTGAIDTGLISMGEGANGPARFLTQTLTSLVDGFNEMPEWGQQTVFWIGAAATAAAVGAGLFMTAVPKVAEYRAAIDTLGPSAQRASRIVTTAAKGLGIVATVAASYALLQQAVEAADEALFKSSDTARNLAANNESLATSYDQLVNSGAQWKDVANNTTDVLDRLGDLDNFFVYIGALDDTGRAAVGLSKALQELSPSLANMPLDVAQEQFAGYAAELGATDAQVLNLLENMPEYKQTLLDSLQAQELAATDANLVAVALGQVGVAAVGATEGADRNAEALAALQGQAGVADEAVNDLAATIRGFGSATLDTRAASRDFQQAIDDLEASVKENGKSLDRSTQAGRDNEASLDALAGRAKEYAAALYTQTGDQKQAEDAMRSGRAELIRQLAQFGITGAKAEAYADDLGLIPESISTAVEVTGAQSAIARANEVAAAIRNIPGYRESVINQVVRTTGAPRGEVGAAYNAQGGLWEKGAKAFAMGGFASGIYPGVPGGLHKFAEGHLPWETYISPDPAYRERNLDIWEETGRRLGAYKPSPAPIVVMAGGDGGSQPKVVVDQTGANFYSYDPTAVAKESVLQMGRALDATGLS